MHASYSLVLLGATIVVPLSEDLQPRGRLQFPSDAKILLDVPRSCASVLDEMRGVAELLQQRETGSRGMCLQRPGPSGIASDIRKWSEQDFLDSCEAKYAAFNPAPRSTIALSYNCDGSLLASTHGDHTVKITACDSKSLVRVLSGHRRTPWVVRFHPRRRLILASGSLDHEVRLWNALTGECIRKYTFGKPIASLSFHYNLDIIAIACGHKLYVWDYKQSGSKPEIVLKTRRSMRAVHFHPHGLPVILTAEVMDPSDTRDLPVTLTDSGPYSGGGENEFSRPNDLLSGRDPSSVTSGSVWMDRIEPNEGIDMQEQSEGETDVADASASPRVLPPSMVPLGWEVPFPSAVRSLAGGHGATTPSVDGARPQQINHTQAAHLAAATYTSVWNIIGEDQPPRVWIRLWSFNPKKFDSYLDDGSRLQLSIHDAVLCSEMGVDFSSCGRFLAATMACKARMHSSFSEAGGIRETPLGMEWSPDRQNQRLVGITRDHQTQISVPMIDKVVFEVRVLSMDGMNFGQAIKARRIRAAHCLTSVQFSPTSDHILLAYGKKHSSLLRSLVAQQNSLIPLHTILEIVRSDDMTVTRALPSTDDEINAAAFHPRAGGGLAYGTKEGKLRFVLAGRNQSPGPSEARSSSSARPSEHQLGNLQRLMMYTAWNPNQELL